MSGLLGEKKKSSSIRSSDVSEIMQILEKMESPHEDEQWRELYENVGRLALTFTRHANVPYSLRFQMKTGRSAMSTGLGV